MGLVIVVIVVAFFLFYKSNKAPATPPRAYNAESVRNKYSFLVSKFREHEHARFKIDQPAYVEINVTYMGVSTNFAIEELVSTVKITYHFINNHEGINEVLRWEFNAKMDQVQMYERINDDIGALVQKLMY